MTSVLGLELRSQTLKSTDLLPEPLKDVSVDMFLDIAILSSAAELITLQLRFKVSNYGI